MISSWKHVTRRMSLGLGVVLLMVLLAACGGSGGASSTGSTPTPKPPTATPTPTTPAVAMQTYTGSGFTISYPQSWKQQAAAGGVAFTDALGVNALTIITFPDPGGVNSANTVATTTFPVIEKGALKNPQPVNVPATTTVGGDTWVQRGAIGTLSANNESAPGEIILLVDNHPANAANTQTYEIFYGGPTTFFHLNTTIFPLMLQSFKFTS